MKPDLQILILDDEADMRELIRFELESAYHVLDAADAEEAVYFLDTNESIHLIISDLKMPGIDGKRLIDSLSKTKKYKNVPILILSAMELEENEHLKYGQQVVGIVRKPFSSGQLLGKVRSILESIE